MEFKGVNSVLALFIKYHCFRYVVNKTNITIKLHKNVKSAMGKLIKLERFVALKISISPYQFLAQLVAMASATSKIFIRQIIAVLVYRLQIVNLHLLDLIIATLNILWIILVKFVPVIVQILKDVLWAQTYLTVQSNVLKTLSIFYNLTSV
jgi:hypothetical protein